MTRIVAIPMKNLVFQMKSLVFRSKTLDFEQKKTLFQIKISFSHYDFKTLGIFTEKL